MRRSSRPLTALLLVALAACPSLARGQIFLEEVPQYELSGDALVSYLGSWQGSGDHLVATHQLSEGLNLSLSGWIFESRFVRFRSYLLALRLDSFGPTHGKGYSLGYGGSLLLMPKSFLPITLSYGHGLGVAGSTLQPSAVTTNTTLQGVAQLVSPVLPRAELRGQRLTADDAAGGHSTSDAITASVYGTSPINQYSAVATWGDQRSTGEPRTTSTLASIVDQAMLSNDTRASFDASLSRSTGLGGVPGDAFTSYTATGALLTRVSPSTLLRGTYGFASDTAPDRQQYANQGALGATVNLKSLHLMLGEGVAATATRYVAPGLDRTVDAVSASQGVATGTSWGPVAGTLSATGQAGYSTVSDGSSGSLYGYGFNAGLQWNLPRSPIRASAFYLDREDRSSAGNSLRSYGGLVSSDVSVWYPVFLLPVVSYTHVLQDTFFALQQEGAAAPATATAFSENDTFSASLTGTSPLFRTRFSFAGGYVDSSSQSSIHLRQLFARVADAFRLGGRTFGNVSLDANHRLGEGSGTNVSALASLVWRFRESSLSASYIYALTLPAGSSSHTAALLFTRSFDVTFLPESR